MFHGLNSGDRSPWDQVGPRSVLSSVARPEGGYNFQCTDRRKRGGMTKFFAFQTMLLVLLLVNKPVAQMDKVFPPDTKAPAPPSFRLLGTWEGRFHADTWITVQLFESRGRITGAVTRNRIDVKPNSEVNRTEMPKSSGRVIEASSDGHILLLKVKDDDSGSVESLEMRLRGDSEVEIREVGTFPRGAPVGKAWSLRKTRTE